MLKKRNTTNLWHNQTNQRQRFSIRKLSIGAASVFLGTAFYLGQTTSVHADTLPDKQVEIINTNYKAQQNPNTSTNTVANNKTTAESPITTQPTSVKTTTQKVVDNVQNNNNATTDNSENKITTDKKSQ